MSCYVKEARREDRTRYDCIFMTGPEKATLWRSRLRVGFRDLLETQRGDENVGWWRRRRTTGTVL